MLSFQASDSPDVIGYKLYISEAPEQVTFSTYSIDIGNVNSIDLSTIDMLTNRQATYNLGVSAIDEAGNMSELSTMDNVYLDFMPPNPPGSLKIELGATRVLSL